MLVVKLIAGSHLFGTSTPESDTDYKGIYIPSARDILLGKVKGTRKTSTGNPHEKNNKDDVDIEVFSLDKFFKMLEQGQTIAYEMLFAPNECIIESSPLWDYLVSRRKEFLHKQTLGFVGYCRQQAAKYGIKGSRMGAIKKVLDFLKTIEDKRSRIKDNLEVLKERFKEEEFVNFFDSETDNIIFFDVCNRKFQSTQRIDHVINILEKIYDGYGHRAKLAEKNEGIDWKALSHAVRVCFQAKEILKDHHLTLPSKEKDLLLKIKKGELPYKDVQILIEEGLEELEILKKTSTLPESIDKELVEVIIMKEYKKIINDNIV